MGQAFLTSCQLYFTLRKSEFQDDEEKIRWILSYRSLDALLSSPNASSAPKRSLAPSPSPLSDPSSSTSSKSSAQRANEWSRSQRSYREVTTKAGSLSTSTSTTSRS